MRLRWTPLALVLVCGCAKFNGIYNSNAAAHSGDRMFARGEPASASMQYAISAAKAETVLVRHPKSRYRSESLYLAGRGFALSNDCMKAMPRLSEYLALKHEPQDRHDRALIALAVCLRNDNQPLAADTILTPLVSSKDSDVRAQAALWAGRVALELGDADRAQRLLALAPGGASGWEFMDAAFARRDFATAESLLIIRARAGDLRMIVQNRIRELWGNDRRSEAVRIVNAYGGSSASMIPRVDLHFLLSDLAAAANDTALARQQAIEAQRIGITPEVESKARVRLIALRIRELDQLSDIQAALVRDSARIKDDSLQKRMSDAVLLIRLFMAGPNRLGAGTYLAAEIARDSLRANRLAHAMFLSIDRDMPESPLGGRALLASIGMFPESAAVYKARIVDKYPGTSAAVAILGGSQDTSSMRSEDGAFRQSHTIVMKQWSDTLKARKTADSIALAARVRQ